MNIRRSKLRRGRFEPGLGTVLDLRLVGRGRRRLLAAEASLLSEIDRLEHVFSAFQPNSELSRWRSTVDLYAPVSTELFGLLDLANYWTALVSCAAESIHNSRPFSVIAVSSALRLDTAGAAFCVLALTKNDSRLMNTSYGTGH